jgi:glucose-6-phosphate 1-dehydrogenase
MNRFLLNFQTRLHYFEGDLTHNDMYSTLASHLNRDTTFPANIAFYMSIRPAEFGVVVENLSEVGLLEQEHGWRRVIIEKPFGYDLDSARALHQRYHAI